MNDLTSSHVPRDVRHRPLGFFDRAARLRGRWPETSRANAEAQRRLYVAEPGIRNYLEYGGHGLLVFDIDHGHRFIKRIPTAGLDAKGVPINVKGICASAGPGGSTSARSSS